MPEIIWVCPMVEFRPEFWDAKVNVICGQFGPFRWSGSSTGANRANPYAVGFSEVTDEQLAALQADPEVHVLLEVDWQRTVGELPGNFRNRINTFCTRVGVERPPANEVLRDLYTRMTQIIDNKVLDDHIRKVRGA